MILKGPTARETSILHYLAWGYSNKEIATRLVLSVKTIESHKANAMRKLGLRRRVDVVKYGLQQGWLTLDTMPPDEEQREHSNADVSFGLRD